MLYGGDLKDFLITYSTWNRLEFTKISIESIAANTNWDLVKEMVIFDNKSVDGTYEYVNSLITSPQIRVVKGDFPSSNFGINKIMQRPKKDLSPYLVKLDNDFCVKEEWLEQIKKVFEEYEKAGTIFLYSTRWGAVEKGLVLPKRLKQVELERRTNPHGGVFATRVHLLKSYGQLPVKKRYAGCQGYGQYVKAKGWTLFNLSVAYELSDPSLQKKYLQRGWERKKKKNRHVWQGK